MRRFESGSPGSLPVQQSAQLGDQSSREELEAFLLDLLAEARSMVGPARFEEFRASAEDRYLARRLARAAARSPRSTAA